MHLTHSSMSSSLKNELPSGLSAWNAAWDVRFSIHQILGAIPFLASRSLYGPSNFGYTNAISNLGFPKDGSIVIRNMPCTAPRKFLAWVIAHNASHSSHDPSMLKRIALFNSRPARGWCRRHSENSLLILSTLQRMKWTMGLA